MIKIDIGLKAVSAQERIGAYNLSVLAMTMDLHYFAWANRHRRIGVYDLTEHRSVSMIEMPSEATALCWDEPGGRLLAGCKDGMLYSFHMNKFADPGEEPEISF